MPEIEEPLEFKLEKLRIQRTSKLAHQSHLAIILSAVEENLTEDNTEKTSAAYFVSFLSLLDQSVSETAIADKELASSIVYLLNLVVPYVSENLLRSKFTPILTKLALVLSNSESDAPLLRSSIGVLETMLVAQDLASWSAPTTQMSPRRGIIGLLALGLDPRPKVRKRAQEAINRVLSQPPPGPKFEHPAATICADMALQSLQSNFDRKRSTSSSNAENSNVKVIHTLQLIKYVCTANGWPAEKVEALCEQLLEISRTTDQYLIVAVFDVFEAVFQSITDEVDSPKLLKILDSIFDLTPSTKDQHLAPAWLAVVAQAIASYARLQPSKAFNRLPKIFKIVIEFLDTDIAQNIHISAAECLIAVTSTAIPKSALLMEKTKSGLVPTDHSEQILSKIGETVFGLLHIKYQGSWNEISQIFVTLFETLRWRAQPHLINSLKVVGVLRSQESFTEGIEGCDKIIGAAIRALGPETVLEHLPMNLITKDGSAVGRAWILPLLRDNIQNARLDHFKKFFLPLIEKIEIKVEQLDDIVSADPNAKAAPVQMKIYRTLIDQIWSLLPKYMDLPTDLQDSFDQAFAEFLSNTLYQKVELRPLICQGLKLVAESNVAYAEGAVDDDVLLQQRFPKSRAAKNAKYLTDKFAAKILSVLFNVFSQTAAESRGYILDTIVTYLEITTADDLDVTFNKVSTILHDSLSKSDANMCNTMLDIVVSMTPFLPKQSHSVLLTIFNTVVPLKDQPQQQKKAFRIIPKLALTEEGKQTIQQYIEKLQEVFINLTEVVTATSRGARLQALFPIIDELPDSELHFIPAILSETVLATKEVNEKTRTSAFDLLVHIANRMRAGGVIDMTKVYGDEAEPINASLEEFFTMVAAGLAGTTPHMISATITGLSRLLFEFRDDISRDLLQELSSTVEMFLTSKNREIVKSTLGFVKITVVSLPIEVLEPNLKELVENLMMWSHESKAHFKSKVKHIIERLIRRFGHERIADVFPEEDAKLLTNIRKTKDRAKRKTKADKQAEGEGTEINNRPEYSNEFDKAVYGSDSDDSDAESEDEASQRSSGNSRRKQNNSNNNSNSRYIVENEDEPLDLLDSRSLARISSSKPTNGKQARPTLRNKFSQDADGKILIKNNDDDDRSPAALDSTDGIQAYISAVKNGPVRGQRNKLKYKRARKFRQESDDENDGYDDDFKKSKPKEFTKESIKEAPQRKKMKPARRKF